MGMGKDPQMQGDLHKLIRIRKTCLANLVLNLIFACFSHQCDGRRKQGFFCVSLLATKEDASAMEP